jgi:hypothetical protein
MLSLENLGAVSSTARTSATCTFLIFIISVWALKTAVGQLDGSYDSHCGPFHHTVDDESVVAPVPLDIRSAGLN